MAYGIEIKNQLAYIESEEFELKLRMCRHLRLVPLFIVRWMPKDWIYRVHREFAGFCLLFKWQLFPLGQEELVSRIKTEPGLSVDCPRSIAEGTIRRLVNWHVLRVRRG